MSPTPTKRAPRAKVTPIRTPAKPTNGTGPEPLAEAFLVPIGQLRPHPDNPRGDATADPVLAASVKAVGVLQPVLARPAGEGFELLAGHRRLDAARRAGLQRVPVVIRPATDTEAVEAMLVENLAREDLSPIEEASGFKRLTELGRTQMQIAGLFGINQGQVSKRLSLLKLPAVAQKAVDVGDVTIEDGVTLAKLPEKEIADLFKHRVPNDWEITSAVRRHEMAETRRKVLGKLEREGVTILTDAPRWDADRDKGPVSVQYLELDDPEAHLKEPCRAVWVSNQGGVMECCTNPKRHPAPPPDDSFEDEREVPLGKTGADALGGPSDWEQRRAEQKAHAADHARRRAFCADLVAKPRMVDVIEIAAWTLPAVFDIDIHGAAELLAIEGEIDEWTDDDADVWAQSFVGDDIRAQQQLLYAIALDAGEDCAGERRARYYRHLQAVGYELSELESQLLADVEKKPAEDALPDGPVVSIEQNGKRWVVTCEECGKLGPGNTTENYARLARANHLADKHGIKS